MTLQELLASLKAARAAPMERLEALFAKITTENRTFTPEEQASYDKDKSEVDQIDKQIENAEGMINLAARSARPPVVVPGSENQPTNTPNPAGNASIILPPSHHIVQTNQVPRGRRFTRYAMALLASRGNLPMAAEISRRWGDTPEVETILRAAVAAGTTTDPAWAAPLVQYQNMASEFIELLRPATILGRMSGFRTVPFNIRIPRQTAGATAGWVGEGQPKPLSALAFDSITLGHYKIAVIVAITEELARFSNPSAESTVQRDMQDTIAQFMDQQFTDPAITAVAGVRPASITNGVTPIPSAGPTEANAQADIKAALTAMATAQIPMSAPFWIMNPRTRINMSMMRFDPNGNLVFPGLQNTPPTLEGIPVIESTAMALAGDPLAGNIILIDASQILMADDGEILLDSSREATLQMDSAPTLPQTGLVSMWQTNMVALKAERFINYLRRRAGAVQIITGVQY
jgi:HK97 family phage major capsid protein